MHLLHCNVATDQPTMQKSPLLTKLSFTRNISRKFRARKSRLRTSKQASRSYIVTSHSALILPRRGFASFGTQEDRQLGGLSLSSSTETWGFVAMGKQWHWGISRIVEGILEARCLSKGLVSFLWAVEIGLQSAVIKGSSKIVVLTFWVLALLYISLSK